MPRRSTNRDTAFPDSSAPPWRLWVFNGKVFEIAGEFWRRQECDKQLLALLGAGRKARSEYCGRKVKYEVDKHDGAEINSGSGGA